MPPLAIPRSPALRRRDRRPEVMDDPSLDPGLHRAALAGLERVHAVTRSAAAVWRAARPAAEEAARRGARLSVLDVATGGGAIALGLARLARSAGLPVDVEGVDLSPVALAFARERAAARRLDVRFDERDALSGELPPRDVVTTTLFLHHLDEHGGCELLARMARAARRRVIVHDLARSRAGYALAWAGTRALTRSRVVHVDGPRSVAAALSPAEALELARRAGLAGARVRREAFCRWTLVWERPG